MNFVQRWLRFFCLFLLFFLLFKFIPFLVGLIDNFVNFSGRFFLFWRFLLDWNFHGYLL